MHHYNQFFAYFITKLHNYTKFYLFISAYNFARRLKTLKGLTPYEYICKIWTNEPERFRLDPLHQMPGLNTECGRPHRSVMRPPLRGLLDFLEARRLIIFLVSATFLSGIGGVSLAVTGAGTGGGS